MHVLLIPSWYPSTDNPISGIFFKEQAVALSNSGLEVGVIVPRLISLKQLRYYSSFEQGTRSSVEDGVKTYRLNGWNWSWKIRSLRMRHWLDIGKQLFDEYVSEQGVPDIIHAHCALPAGILASRIRKNHHIPFVITEHSSLYVRKLLNSFDKHQCANVFISSDVNIAVSPSFASLLSDIFPDTSESWRWVPNLISQRFMSAFQENKSLIEHLQQINFVQPQKKFRFLNVGLLTDNKGQADLIEAFSSAAHDNENFELFIGGDGPKRTKLENLVKRKGLENSIFFLGTLSREDVIREMSKADVFVLSSHYETFGVVLIEALAFGKPLIATACGGPECIVTTQNGLLVEKGNTQQMAEALKYMKLNIDKYDANAIRKTCIDNFGPVRVATMLKEIYANLL